MEQLGVLSALGALGGRVMEAGVAGSALAAAFGSGNADV